MPRKSPRSRKKSGETPRVPASARARQAPGKARPAKQKAARSAHSPKGARPTTTRKAATKPRRLRPVKPSGRTRRFVTPDPVRVAAILEQLHELYPDARCALEFRTPLQLLIATILSAQCTDERVNMVTPALFARYPDAPALAAAKAADVEAMIHSTGFFRNKAKTILQAAATSWPGTAARCRTRWTRSWRCAASAARPRTSCSGTLIGIPGLVVDTHVTPAREPAGADEARQDPVKIEFALMPVVPRERWTLFSHWLILHGRRVCIARKPRCSHLPARAALPQGGRHGFAVSARTFARLAGLWLLCAPVATARAARAPSQVPLLTGFESVAAAEDARGVFTNPAGMGVRQPNEALFAWQWLTDGGTQSAQVLAGGHFGVWAVQDTGSTRTWGYALSSGREAFRTGWATSWNQLDHPGGTHYWDHRIGVLARPVPWMSLGTAVDHAFRPKLAGEALAREWTAGLGLRPLALRRSGAYTQGPRLTLTGDVRWAEGGDATQARTLIGAELEAVDGLVLRGALGDHGAWRAGLAIRGVRWTPWGAEAHARAGRRARAAGVSLHSGEERTVFRARREARVAVLRLRGALEDEPAPGGLLGGGGGLRAQAVHEQLQRALEDPLTHGVLLELGGLRGMAQVEELRPKLARLEAAGKPVVAWLEQGGGRADLYLGGAANRIVASPLAEFGPLGLRVEKRYWRQPLARLGVRVDRSSIGEYKSAYREYSVDSLPPADREAIDHTLDQVQSLFVSALAADRRVEPARIEPVLDGRLYTATDLQSAGLVDSLGYREDALRMLGRLAGLGDSPRTVKLRETRAARRAWTVPAPIAVVHASGVIVTGESGGDLLEGATLGHETFARTLERAMSRHDVRAVVLRVDSPGGSSIASALMDHAVERAKRRHRKPLIVSMGPVAASGGYFLACHADRILADRFSYTGSIGVLYVKPSFEGLYAKLGVHTDVLERGDYMAGWSYARDWDARMQASADSVVVRDYELFVNRVAEGRGRSFTEIEPVARGRVWLGDDAREHGLVDAIGGLDDAIAEARGRARVPEGERIRVQRYGRPRPGLVEQLVGRLLHESLARELSTSALAGGLSARDPWTEWLPE